MNTQIKIIRNIAKNVMKIVKHAQMRKYALSV